MTTNYDDQLELKLKKAELLQEQIAMLQRVRDIELEINSIDNAVNTVAVTATKAKAKAPVDLHQQATGEVKRRGRPKGSTNAVAATEAPVNGGEVRRRGRPKGSTNAVKAAKSVDGGDGDGKSIHLPTLLETIAQQINRPLVLAEFVTLAREAGYTTKAKDFSNMVYQSVLKLTKKGMFKKNDENRTYEYVGTKAA